MLLASLFHFAQAQTFGHLELQNGFTLLISSDVAAQVSVAVIFTTPTATRDSGDFSAEVAPAQLGRLKSLIILQEFVRCYRGDIDRLAAESIAQAELKAEEYTLTSALNGFQNGFDGTLDEFITFQADFVGLVMETTARGIQNVLMSWDYDGAAIVAKGSSSLRLERGFLLNADTGDVVYSTPPAADGCFFDQDLTSRRLHHLHKTERVQELIKQVAKALHESSPALLQSARDKDSMADVAVVVRCSHLSGQDLSELFIALRMLPTGVFSAGIVFYGDNGLFRGRESELQSSGKLQQALTAHPCGKSMLNVLRDSSVDVQVHVGLEGAPEEVWTAMDLLIRPLAFACSSSDATNIPHKANGGSNGTSHDRSISYQKENATPRLPQPTE
ncbi:hypothetical protein V7S43_012118 [Phytophthora oleae]|uniref:FIST domain-containing protein n=1 Tax=Phytophthora oleae TaxID=2107226 RepID=A0ABD3F8E3_9STRA